MENHSRKVYVEVTTKVNLEGCYRPLSFIWEDGREYEIDRLKHICRASSLKVGGCGTRYTVMIQGKETFMYQEDEGPWYMVKESKN